jgi:hypothetical protein
MWAYDELVMLKYSMQDWLNANPVIRSLLAQKKLCSAFESRSEEYGNNLFWYPNLVVPLYADYLACGFPRCDQGAFNIVLSAFCYRNGDLESMKASSGVISV